MQRVILFALDKDLTLFAENIDLKRKPFLGRYKSKTRELNLVLAVTPDCLLKRRQTVTSDE